MQQIQAQVPTPQQPKRKRFSRSMMIGIAVVVAIIIGGLWIAAGVGWLPALFGLTPTNVAFIASVVAAILGGLFAFIQIVPQDKNDTGPEVIPQPIPPNINVYVTPHQPGSPIPPPTPDPSPVPAPPPSLPYRGMAQPPSTNSKIIQQRPNAVREVYEKLTQPETSAVVLTGIGGQGKSTLAALVYSYVEQQRQGDKGPFKRETLWLRVENNDTFLTVADNIFNALGNRPDNFEKLPTQSQAYTLFNALKKFDPPLLIVLDQFENLLNLDTGEALTPETGELLEALNNASCPSRLLLTSRPRPKGIRMTTYDSLVLYPVSDLTIAEGQALLKSRGVTTATEDDLRIAVQRCNGHSLSLCLLASLLDENKLSLSTLLNDPSYKRLWDENVAEKLLEEIYKRLNDHQREVLHALSIYREAVPRDAIQALVNDATKAQLNTLLGTLQAQQLVQVVEEDRRQLHPIVAIFVQNYDKQNNKASTLLDHGKAAHYYVQQAEKKCPPRDKRGLTDVQPLIEAVWQFCQAEQWQEAYKLMNEEGLFKDIRRWGGNVILLELCQSLLPEYWQPQPLQAGIIYSNIAYVYGVLGQNQKALEYHNKDLEVTRAAGDRGGEGVTLNNLGRVYNGLGQKQEALKYYEQALTIFGQVGDRGGEGVTLNNLGGVYDDLGQKQEALRYYEQALAIFGQVGDRGGEGTTLNNLGRVYDGLGQKQEAVRYYEQALAIRREVGDRFGEATTLHNIGAIYYDEKRFDIAHSCFILAKQILVEIQSPDSDDEQNWIDDLHQEIGDQQFATLFQTVEPNAQQIVDDALRKIRE